MTRARVAFVYCIFCSICFPLDLGGDNRAATDARVGQHLKMLTIGNGKLPSGHPMAFRIYEAADGTKGRIIYAGLPSLESAHQQILEWLKLATEIQEHKDGGEQRISERIVAIRKVVKSSKAEYMIIRRDGANCYLIESLSLQVAKEVEGTIG